MSLVGHVLARRHASVPRELRRLGLRYTLCGARAVLKQRAAGAFGRIFHPDNHKMEAEVVVDATVAAERVKFTVHIVRLSIHM